MDSFTFLYLTVQPTPFAKTPTAFSRYCVANFAHIRALPQTAVYLANPCKPNLPGISGLAELLW